MIFLTGCSILGQ